MNDLQKSVQSFVAAAIRRLWWLQSLRRLQIAAATSALAAALAAGTHILIVSLPAWLVLLIVPTPWLFATLACLAARPTAQQAAWWIDRDLAGASLFSTWQDFLLAGGASASARAQLGLQTRTAAALHKSSAQLAALSMPGQWRLFWLAASCVLFCCIVVMANGRQLQPPKAAGVAAVAASQADPGPIPSTARDELRRALLTESRDSATQGAAADLPADSAPPEDDPGSQLVRSRETRTSVTAGSDAAATGGLGAGAGLGRSSLQTAPANPNLQLTERFREIGGVPELGLDGADDRNGFASSVGGLLGTDRDYDRRQAQLARRVAPATGAAHSSLRALNPSAVELMRRYVAIKEPLP